MKEEKKLLAYKNKMTKLAHFLTSTYENRKTPKFKATRRSTNTIYMMKGSNLCQ